MVVEMKRSKAAASRGQQKKNLWRPEEDLILKKYIETHGEGNWATVSKRSGLMRSGKSCRLRWKNYLRPNIKRGDMSQEEQDLILRMHKLLGNRWSLIAGRLPGRTDNEVKNYWNTHLNKMASTCYSNHDHLHTTKKQNTLTTTTTTTTTTDRPMIMMSSTETKKDTTDDRDEEPNLGSNRKGEESDANNITAANPCLWFGDTTSTTTNTEAFPLYYVPTNFNHATFAFDDEPFIAYMDSFLLFEAFGSSTTTTTTTTTTASTTTPGTESDLPLGCHDESDHPHSTRI